MLFTTFLPALAVMSSVLGGSLKERHSRRTARQPFSPNVARDLLGVTACVTVAAGADVNVVTPSLPVVNAITGGLGISVPNVANTPITVELQEGLCLCTVNGVITNRDALSSFTSLQNQLSLGVNVLNVATLNTDQLQGILGIDLAGLTDLVAQALIRVLPAPGTDGQPAACTNYPTEGSFEPFAPSLEQCSDCNFRCVDPTPQLCNGQCVAANVVCPSAAPVGRRRSFSINANANLLCARGLTACAIPGRSAKFIGQVECLDTMGDVETCGGCEFPLPGKPKGTNCGAIDNVDIVQCVSGKCIIEACLEGFTVAGQKCIRV